MRLFEESRLLEPLSQAKESIDEGTQPDQAADGEVDFRVFFWIFQDAPHLPAKRQDGGPRAFPEAALPRDAPSRAEQECHPGDAVIDVRAQPH